MIPTRPLWLSMLRVGLGLSAAGWGISFFFAFAPWARAAYQLHLMGAGPIFYDPLLDYWLRMAGSAFGAIGLASGVSLVRPHAMLGFIRFLAPFHLLVGTTLIMAAIRNDLRMSAHPTFVPDITFCLVTALLVGLPLLQAGRSHRRRHEEGT